MKVKDLIKKLNKANPEAVVVLASDEEGNTFAPLNEANTENLCYNADDGVIGYKTLDKEALSNGATSDELVEGEDCVVLWP